MQQHPTVRQGWMNQVCHLHQDSYIPFQTFGSLLDQLVSRMHHSFLPLLSAVLNKQGPNVETRIEDATQPRQGDNILESLRLKQEVRERVSSAVEDLGGKVKRIYRIDSLLFSACLRHRVPSGPTATDVRTRSSVHCLHRDWVELSWCSAVTCNPVHGTHPCMRMSKCGQAGILVWHCKTERLLTLSRPLPAPLQPSKSHSPDPAGDISSTAVVTFPGIRMQPFDPCPD